MFDLLYLNGKALVREPLFKRRSLLHEKFHEVEGECRFATSIDTSTMEEVQDFLEESVKGKIFAVSVKNWKKVPMGFAMSAYNDLRTAEKIVINLILENVPEIC
jgi:hypothetical protein